MDHGHSHSHGDHSHGHGDHSHSHSHSHGDHSHSHSHGISSRPTDAELHAEADAMNEYFFERLDELERRNGRQFTEEEARVMYEQELRRRLTARRSAAPQEGISNTGKKKKGKKAKKGKGKKKGKKSKAGGETKTD